LRIKNEVACTEPNRLIPVITRRLAIVDKFLKDLFFKFFEVNDRISHSYMARQFPGTRLSLTLEAKSLQYKSHALTLKNCVLPSFLCYRANKGVLRRKQAMCWFRQRSENFSLPPFLGTKSRLLTCRARQPRSKIVTSLLVVVVRLK
jgi:hypothetical protein